MFNLYNNVVNEAFFCSCCTPGHQFVVNYFKDDDYPELYISINLVDSKSFFQRLVVGIKYILGFKSKYDDGFDEVILKADQVTDLKCLLEEYLRLYHSKVGETDA